VDFNSDRCIGCKACMQACPYDALYIDPESNTAAKCNFCTHRLEVGLEPSCVVVCPERAIVAGDLDDPVSEISRLIHRFPVQVRKPEKGTRPKLYYIDGDESALVPTAAEADGQYMWSGGPAMDEQGNGAVGSQPSAVGQHSSPTPDTGHRPQGGHPTPYPQPLADVRRVYDVRPRTPAWGWAVVSYIWTKSIATGGFLAAAAARFAFGPEVPAALQIVLGSVAMLFLIVTGVLLVIDLKQPKRFLYVLLRPQWQSWLVRGAYILTAYGAVLALWLAASALGWRTVADLLLWPGVVLAALTAVYTAFLFAQAKGRDLWQNPLFSMHLLAHAVLAAGATWLLVDWGWGLGTGGSISISQLPAPSPQPPAILLALALTFSLIALLAECFTVPPTDDSRRAIHMILAKPMGGWFWGVGVALGHIVPLVLLVTGIGWLNALAAVLALVGMGVIEWLWVSVPQRIPLS
jgi:formate-dependent nitrite reductase membrane component NrfD/ferredoxin